MTALLTALLALPPGGPTLMADNELIVVMVQGDNSIGTGVVVQKQPLTVATCFHVIAHAKNVKVRNPVTNNEFKATTAATYPQEDFAFVRVPGTSWGQSESWPPKPTANGDAVTALGFGHADLDQATVATLNVANSVTKIRKLAALYATTVPHDFEIVSFVNGTLRRGDSGGPVFDSKGRLIGLSTGRFHVDGSDDTANFAIRPARAMPKDGEFKPLAAAVNHNGAYVAGGSVTPTALTLAVRIDQRTGGSSAHGIGHVAEGPGAACVREMEAALAALRPEPPQDLPKSATIDASCRQRYAEVRKVEVALRTEYAAVRNAQTLADNAEAFENLSAMYYPMLFEGAVSRADLDTKPIKPSYRKLCEALRAVEPDKAPGKKCRDAMFSFVAGDAKWDVKDKDLFGKAAADMLLRGDVTISPAGVEYVEKLPPAWTFTAKPITGLDFLSGVKDVEKSRQASAKFAELALGTATAVASKQVIAHVAASAVDPTRKRSSVLLRESADARADAVERLAKARNELIRKVAEGEKR
jgi:hypothetical protein